MFLGNGDHDFTFKVVRALNKNNDPQRMLRSLPSMYQILPAPGDCYPDWNPSPLFNIWNPDAWEGLGAKIDRNYLQRAYDHHRHLSQADPQVPIYCIIGALYDTPVELTDGDFTRAMIKRILRGTREGDGTVTTVSALFRDKPAYYVHEIHQELVLERRVIDAIAEWLEGADMPSTLVKNLADVIEGDAPFRGEGPMGFEEDIAAEVSADQIAAKVSADQPLDHDELKSLNMMM